MKTLRIGMRGDEVRTLQTLLASARLMPASAIDGIYGPLTTAAVLAFQIKHNLVADGIVGPVTLMHLNADASAPDTHTAATQHDTTGADEVALPSVISATGFYSRAVHHPAAPGRQGLQPIVPDAIVLHTTDCAPGTFATLIRRWGVGFGSCCTFLIGRDASDGIAQMLSVFKNAYHAGAPKGEPHGNFAIDGKPVHPNSVAVGIEFDCAGRLGKRTDRGWVHKDSGIVIPDDEVDTDAKGIGWHRITDYQVAEYADMYQALKRLGVGRRVDNIMPNGNYKQEGVAWALPDIEQPRHVAGHVQLDPRRKTDPGPFNLQRLLAVTI